jgi:hypothetical protein
MRPCHFLGAYQAGGGCDSPPPPSPPWWLCTPLGTLKSALIECLRSGITAASIQGCGNTNLLVLHCCNAHGTAECQTPCTAPLEDGLPHNPLQHPYCYIHHTQPPCPQPLQRWCNTIRSYTSCLAQPAYVHHECPSADLACAQRSWDRPPPAPAASTLLACTPPSYSTIAMPQHPHATVHEKGNTAGSPAVQRYQRASCMTCETSVGTPCMHCTIRY